ncbi:MAG: PAS domain S-box protein [Candidatus Krumholzibacteriota bacterium]|nr:PAS domain S-box protein [Candidatus Krumholzibacteriota bacterium]
MRLRTNIILLIVMIVMITGLGSSLMVNRMMHNMLAGELNNQAVIAARSLAEHISHNVINGEIIEAQETVIKMVQNSRSIQYAYVIDFDGRLFTHSFEGGFPSALAGEQYRYHRPVSAQSPVVLHLKTDLGQIADFGYPLIEGMKAHIHIGINEDFALARITALRNRIIGFTLLLACIGIAAGIFMSRFITRPLSEFLGAMRDFGTRKRQEEIDLKSGGKEIADLTLAFNSMISDLKRTEEERERLMSAIEQAAETVIITDIDGTIQYVNPVFESFTGFTCEEVIGHSVLVLKSDMHDDDFYQEMWDTVSSGGTWNGRFVSRKKSGLLYTEEVTISPVRDSSGAIINYVAVKHDITENIRLEQQYNQAQKVESIGRLAGGIAHDLNNLLSPILGYGELLQEDLDPDDERRKSVDEILRAGFRARDLVRQLLAFSRKQTLEYKPFDMNEAVTGIEKLLRRTIREDIEIKIFQSPGIRMVMMDLGQIEQVIMNLVSNAQDAMPEGGRLTIEVSEIELDENYASRYQDVEPGMYVMLAVSDTGCGMDDETRERVFDPFFSTKGALGTGLGLATVFGVVKQHCGHIWVYSEPGEGTTFKVFLPVSENKYTEEKPVEKMIIDLKGSETILLVEDNEQVRNLTHIIIKRQGYTVLVAKNGEEALAAMEAHAGSVQLLLTDVIMPGMNGTELYEKASAKDPDLKVLFMSGYTDNVIAFSGVLEAGTFFIQKPFTSLTLAAKIREVLDN